uniref:Uncharacterized protein n=1 Tax=Parascaris univalens TaxID=6257 RepID=A0A915A754_PARUN
VSLELLIFVAYDTVCYRADKASQRLLSSPLKSYTHRRESSTPLCCY